MTRKLVEDLHQDFISKSGTKRIFGILNFMLVNGQVAGCKISGIIQNKLHNKMWRLCVADLMLQWKDPHKVSYDSPCCSYIIVEHGKWNLGKEWKVKRPRCIVCGFETSIRDGLKLIVEGCTNARCKKNMVCCSNPGCNIMAYVHSGGENKRFIFHVPGFIRKTCFEIAHDDMFRGMFAETNNLAS